MKSVEEIKRVLEEFNDLNVSYVLLRNYEFLFDKAPGKDVDISVKREDVPKIRRVLTSRLFFQQNICPYSGHIGFYKFIKEDNKLIKFHFHINGISGRHLIYSALDSLLKNKKFVKKIPVISDEDTLISLLLHSKLGKGAREEYVNKIKEILNKNFDKKYVKNRLEAILDTETVQKILTLLYAQKFNELDALKPLIKRRIVIKNPGTIFNVLKIKIPCVLWKIKEILKGAQVVSFIGMDGAGKTTLSNKILEILVENKIKTIRIYTGRGKNNLLPIQKIGKPFKNFEKRRKINKTLGKIIYTISSFFFFTDLFLRYWLTIYPSRFRNKLVITDRYTSDILLMKNTPVILKKIYYSLLPKPQLTFYIYNDLAVLHKRKPDHPLEDLQRQEKIFNQINSIIMPVKVKNDNLTHSIELILKVLFENSRF